MGSVEPTEPESLPHINENDSFLDDTKSPKVITTTATKMFGKYFDKRATSTCSDTTHNSVWSESEAYDEIEHDENGYILTQFAELDSDTMSKTSSFSPRSNHNYKPPAKL